MKIIDFPKDDPGSPDDKLAARNCKKLWAERHLSSWTDASGLSMMMMAMMIMMVMMVMIMLMMMRRNVVKLTFSLFLFDFFLQILSMIKQVLGVQDYILEHSSKRIKDFLHRSLYIFVILNIINLSIIILIILIILIIIMIIITYKYIWNRSKAKTLSSVELPLCPSSTVCNWWWFWCWWFLWWFWWWLWWWSFWSWWWSW